MTTQTTTPCFVLYRQPNDGKAEIIYIGSNKGAALDALRGSHEARLHHRPAGPAAPRPRPHPPRFGALMSYTDNADIGIFMRKEIEREEKQAAQRDRLPVVHSHVLLRLSPPPDRPQVQQRAANEV